MPYEEYQRLERLDEKEIVFRFDRLLESARRRSAKLSEEEVAADVHRAHD